MSIDEDQPQENRGVFPYVPSSWSEAQIEALDKWGQGSLIKSSMMAWAIPITPVVGADTVGAPNDVSLDVVFRAAADEWAVVTSQTCDVACVGPGCQHPFVQVSPLVNLDGEIEDTIRDCLSWSLTYMAPIQCHPSGGQWAADLRISTPISKDILLHTTPVPGFSDDDHLLRFSEHIARRLTRPAYHEVVSGIADIVASEISLAKKTDDTTWFEGVEQVRFEIVGQRLDPQSISLHVITIQKLSIGDKKRWRGLQRRVRTLLKPLGADFGRIAFSERDLVTARNYREWHPLFIKGLQDRHFL